MAVASHHFSGHLPPNTAAPSRAALARSRLPAAREALRDCRLCAHDCRVDRLGGGSGVCRASAETRVFSTQLDLADEEELVPAFAVALSGCDLRCAFCISGAPSWNPAAGELVPPALLAARAEGALANGARTILFEGGEPTIHLPYLLAVVGELPDDARLVLKTNAYGAATGRELLDGVFDVWCADYKFGNDACADRLARIPDYTRVVRENLRWAAARSDLIVRHLLMPGHGECCWRSVAEWLAVELPGVKVSLRTGFWPAWQARRHAELKGPATAAEVRRAEARARKLPLNLIH